MVIAKHKIIHDIGVQMRKVEHSAPQIALVNLKK
jgi:hypothetical protein